MDTRSNYDYAITITTKKKELGTKENILAFMAFHYSGYKYNLIFEAHPTKNWIHAHGTISINFLPKDNRLNDFFIKINRIKEKIAWDIYINKDNQYFLEEPLLDVNLH